MNEVEEVVEESYSPGLADWLENNVEPDTSPEQAAHLLQQYANEHELPTPDARGVPTSVAFEKLVNWIRRRRLISDEGIQLASFRWFTFHVPPGGKGSISWTRTAARSGGVTLKVFGTGLGGSATLKLLRTLELTGCTACQEIIQHIEVRIRRYLVKSATGVEVEEITLDPVRWLHREPRERKQCCDQSLDTLDRFKFEMQEADAVDARKTTALLKDERELELKFGFNSCVKLELLGGLDVGLELKSEGGLSCTTTYEFPPGTLYMPYVKRNDRGVPPQWSIG